MRGRHKNKSSILSNEAAARLGSKRLVILSEEWALASSSEKIIISFLLVVSFVLCGFSLHRVYMYHPAPIPTVYAVYGSEVRLDHLDELKLAVQESEALATAAAAIPTYTHVLPDPEQRSFYSDDIRTALLPWAGAGLRQEDFDAMLQHDSKSLVHYQIIGGRVYRQKICFPFKARCRGIEHFLLKAARSSELDAVELMVNIRDMPQRRQSARMHDTLPPPLPFFSFSIVPKRHTDLMFPAWAFWQGGPQTRVTRDWNWDHMRTEMMSASRAFEWAQRDPRAFFRGTRTCTWERRLCTRDYFVRLSRTYPDIVDAQYTEHFVPAIDAAVRAQIDLNYTYAESVPLRDHCRYKYLLNTDGVAASFRLKNILLCGSVVLVGGSSWAEFFYGKMRPWVHYVPLRADGSDLRDVVNFLRRHDVVARQIGRNGQSFVAHHLRMSDVEGYWAELLRQYAALQTYVPVRADRTIEIIE